MISHPYFGGHFSLVYSRPHSQWITSTISMIRIIVIGGGLGNKGPLNKDEFALNDRRNSTMGPP
jgi:hypothetical protein